MAAPSAQLRTHLSAPGLYSTVRQQFKQEPITKRHEFSDADVVSSAVAMFTMKYPSLLQFDTAARTDPTVAHNLQSLFGVEQAPSDTQLRDRLDVIEPDAIQAIFPAIWRQLQRQGELASYATLDGHWLIAVDGTGHFASNTVHCEHCCVKNSKKNGTQYYHQLLGAVCVHPEHKHVLPIGAEPITRADGDSKNDCERNAAKRLLPRIRQAHPRAKLCIVEDALASNAPHIALLKELDMRFILGVKFTDHQALATSMQQAMHRELCVEHEHTNDDGSLYGWRIYRDLPLNKTHAQCLVNVVEYWELSAKGKEKYFSWVTDIVPTEANVMDIVRGGRARWRIENETFNTLKNQGYHLEHNYGHGKKHLATNLGLLTMASFLIDQIQQRCCRIVGEAIAAHYCKRDYWQRLCRLFLEFEIHSWEGLYRVIAGKLKGPPARALFADSG